MNTATVVLIYLYTFLSPWSHSSSIVITTVLPYAQFLAAHTVAIIIEEGLFCKC